MPKLSSVYQVAPPCLPTCHLSGFFHRIERNMATTKDSQKSLAERQLDLVRFFKSCGLAQCLHLKIFCCPPCNWTNIFVFQCHWGCCKRRHVRDFRVDVQAQSPVPEQHGDQPHVGLFNLPHIPARQHQGTSTFLLPHKQPGQHNCGGYLGLSNRNGLFCHVV